MTKLSQLFSATDEQNFKDGAVFYRFTADDGHEGSREKEQRRVTQSASKIEFLNLSAHSCKTLAVSKGWINYLMLGLMYTFTFIYIHAPLHVSCQ